MQSFSDHFSEKQRFNKPVHLLIYGGIFVVTCFTNLITYHSGTLDSKLLFISFLPFLVVLTLIMLVIKLETKISDQGIEYRYFPFHFKFHLIKWEEIRHCEVIEYSPLWDYGGWGIRWSSNGKAYNVSGKTGLQVYMKNGKKILFGTQKRQEMETAVKNAKMA